MKNILTSICTTALLSSAILLNAGETAPHTGNSKEFERMKFLVGTWKGTADMGQGLEELTVEYRLIAAGSVLEERVFAGTPNEMVTMYYEENGRLAMTHYCMFGNRPAMKLKSSDADTLYFDFDATCGIDPKQESHMHALSIRFNDKNTITTSCIAMIDGNLIDPQPTQLTRVDS